jgi:hypothetical protein
MRSALEDLRLDHLWILYPGHERYLADERITVCPFVDVATLEAEMY